MKTKKWTHKTNKTIKQNHERIKTTKKIENNFQNLKFRKNKNQPKWKWNEENHNTQQWQPCELTVDRFLI